MQVTFIEQYFLHILPFDFFYLVLVIYLAILSSDRCRPAAPLFRHVLKKATVTRRCHGTRLRSTNRIDRSQPETKSLNCLHLTQYRGSSEMRKT